MSFAVRLLVTLALLSTVIWWAGPRELLPALSTIHVGWLIEMVLLVLLFVMLGAVGIHVLTKGLIPSLESKSIFTSYLRSFAIGMFAPSKLGDFSYPYFLAGGENSYGPGLAIVVVDKAVTAAVWSLGGIVGIAAFVGVREASIVGLAIALGGGAAVTLLGSEKLRSLVRRYVLKSREQYFSGFSKCVVALVTGHRGLLAANVALTALRLVVGGAAIQVGYRSLGVSVDLLSTTTVMAGVQLVGWIPISVSGLGLTHGSAAVFFGACCAIARPITVDLFLLNSVLSYLLAGCVIIVLGLKRRGTDARKQTESEHPQ